jgi:uncharacterized membrane-anchored protein YhcB (DUF1043 family)
MMSSIIAIFLANMAEKWQKVINHLGQTAQSLITLLISQST